MLRLDEPTGTLGERFHAGDLPAEVVASDPLLARWARAARAGARPDAEAHVEGATGGELARRRDRLEDLFRDEHALLGPLAAEFASRGLVAIVADPEGVVVASRGGGEFASSASRARLVEGSNWAECARGTNAIGTAIAEGRAVAVIGRAHYEARNADLFCYATPVRDAYGELACVLDVTGSLRRHDPTVGVAAAAAGAALELALRTRAFAASVAGGLPVLGRLVQRCRGPALLVEANGAVRVANEAARAALRAATPLSCEQVFGVPFAELLQRAAAGQRGHFATRWADFDVELEPVAGAGGRALAMLVYLEPVARRAPPAPPRPGAAPPPGHPAFARVLGDDPAVARARALAARFAATSLPVLLLAETGTGKELFARAIHEASARAAGPFVALNCGALSPALLESELFGYAPGAFTGASRRGSDGKLGAAHGGTLFLDEVAEMPPALQASLLRVLDDGAYHRVGDARPRRADFRLVCATCRDLPALIERGAFRRDLFYRIHGACVTIPPLRARSDRAGLARALLEHAAPDGEAPPLDDDALAWLESHDWPGNVRELKHALAHAVALADGGPLRREHFPAPLAGAAAWPHAGPGARPAAEAAPPPPVGYWAGSAVDEGEPKTREALLREAVVGTVRACRGNLSEAARRLGVARSTVYRALGKKGLARPGAVGHAPGTREPAKSDIAAATGGRSGGRGRGGRGSRDVGRHFVHDARRAQPPQRAHVLAVDAALHVARLPEHHDAVAALARRRVSQSGQDLALGLGGINALFLHLQEHDVAVRLGRAARGKNFDLRGRLGPQRAPRIVELRLLHGHPARRARERESNRKGGEGGAKAQGSGARNRLHAEGA